MGNSNDYCSSCSFVKKDQHAQEYDGANKNIRKNGGQDDKSHLLTKELQAKAIAKWKPVEKSLVKL